MTETESILKPDRYFPIPQIVLDHKVQSVLFQLIRDKVFKAYSIAAGRRSFKTERFAKRYTVYQATDNANHVYHLGAPTRIQAKEIFWKDLKGLVPKYLIKKTSESELKIELINGTEINVIGLKEFKRKQGTLSHGVVFSEFQECDPDVFNETFQPMLNDTGGFPIFEGRPFGKNHFFDFFMNGFNIEEYVLNNPNKSISELVTGIKTKANEYRWCSAHWKSDEILSVEQIENAKKDLSLPDYLREYEASFETEFGSPYHSFSQLNLKSLAYQSHLPVNVTCDFNATVKPMSWVIGQTIIEGFTETNYWQKCLSYQYTNTVTMCGILDEYFKTLSTYPKQLHFYGDYAGKQEKSNSSYSDWQIIEDYFRNKSNMQTFLQPCKSIRNSIAATNAQLCNAKNERKQFVDKDECKPLILDWEKCEWKDNSREIKDNDDLRSHACRSVDYFNDYRYPVQGQPVIQLGYAH